jgi:D-galactose 1-dehydrogenase
MPDGTYRLAVVGLGHVFDAQIQALAAARPRLVVTAVCDARSELQGKIETTWPQIFAAAPPRFFPDFSHMFQAVPLDAVLVAVPNDQHYAVARAALEAGLHVLVEKPATETKDQLSELVEIATRQRRLLHTAFHAAFARDLLWYLDNRPALDSITGPPTAFRCGFYDPYLQGATLDQRAGSLGGSWIDSGVNALSVVHRLVTHLAFDSARMTRIPTIRCQQVQGSAVFTFQVGTAPAAGMGVIDTNWTLGRDEKVTDVFFGQTGYRLTLDHTQQIVRLIEPDRQLRVLADYSQELPRLVAHYVGVFQDFCRCLQAGVDNRETSALLLDLLVRAAL